MATLAVQSSNQSPNHQFIQSPDAKAIPGRPRRPRAGLRRRDGHDAVREGRVHQQELRCAERVAAGSRRGSPSGIRSCGRRYRRDEYIRREPHQTWIVRPGRQTPRDQRTRRENRASRGGRSRVRRGRGRAARHPHRTVGQNRRRRSARIFPRAGGGARRRRRRALHPRNVS